MAIDLTQADEWWDEAEGLDNELQEFLDGIHRKRYSERRRMFVVLARDEHNQWRARQVPALSAADAQKRYEDIFTVYEVVGVANLEGSGHPIEWVNGWHPNINGSSTG
jgi:hypothetical protein